MHEDGCPTRNSKVVCRPTDVAKGRAAAVADKWCAKRDGHQGTSRDMQARPRERPKAMPEGRTKLSGTNIEWPKASPGVRYWDVPNNSPLLTYETIIVTMTREGVIGNKVWCPEEGEWETENVRDVFPANA